MTDKRKQVDDNLPDWMQPYRGAGDGRKAGEKLKQADPGITHQFEIGQQVYVKKLSMYGIVYAYNPWPPGFMVSLRHAIIENIPIAYGNKFHSELNRYVWEPTDWRFQRQWSVLCSADELE